MRFGFATKAIKFNQLKSFVNILNEIQGCLIKVAKSPVESLS